MVYGFGYRSYTNSEQITHQFLGDIAYHDPKQHLLMDYDSWITGMLKALNATDVFYIPSSVESTAVTRLRDFFASLTRRNRRKVVVQDTLEDSHDPLRFYLRNMLDANSVIVHLDDPESAGASINNTKCSFLAGMAVGFGRNVLLVAPAPFDSPLDYRSLVVQYRDAGRCKSAVEDWLKSIFMTRVEVRTDEDESERTLLAFHIGETTAESEELELSKYFVPTRAYSAAVKSKMGVFVGRKGTGKTANLYQLRDHFAKEKNNVVVTIKPIAFRIATFGRLIEDYFPNPDIAADFIERTWRAIIYAEIAVAVSGLIDRDTRFREMTAEETSVLKYIEDHSEFVEADFAGKIEIIRAIVTESVAGGYSANRALRTVAEELSRPLVEAYSSIFRRFQQIVVLVDNLDKAWSISEDRTVQTRLIFGLLEFQGTIGRELSSTKGDVRILVFLREDIFAHVMRDANEPDKVRLVFSQITWPDVGQLVDLLERRFHAWPDVGQLVAERRFHAPTLPDGAVWDTLFCPEVAGRNTKEYLLDHVMPRPRDLIHVVRSAIDSCVGKSRSRIEGDDLKDAFKEYFQFLIDNMFTEYGSYLSNLRDLVQGFAGSGVRHSGYQIWRTVRPFLRPNGGFFEVVEFLFRVSFLGIERSGEWLFAYTNDDAERLLPVVRRGLRWYGMGRTQFVIHRAFHAGLQLGAEHGS